jgi:poly(A) polymerase
MTHDFSAERETVARTALERLRSAGYQAYLVGGCVRDMLLGITPKDFDIGTDARPEQVLERFPGSQVVGAHFGVVMVTTSPGVQVEIATFRSERDYRDGRHPEHVGFENDPALDAQRRDFTINALMQDPFSGRILDYVGGQKDLKARHIRAIGNAQERFLEDHLRMLRAVRFAARLEFDVEPETMAAIQEQAHRIRQISPERVRDELVRILTQGHARRGFELLDQSKLLEFLLPDVQRFHGVMQPPEFHPEGDVWAHIMLMLELMDSATCTLALGVLLHDVGKPSTFRVADRIRFDGHAEAGAKIAKRILCDLRFSNSDVERVTALVANHMRFKDVRQMKTSTLKRFLALPHFDEHLELHRLDCLASNGYTDSYNYVTEKLAEFKAKDLKPARLISGRDLIEEGYLPGPQFGNALQAVETAQLEGEVETKEQALSLAREILGTEA